MLHQLAHASDLGGGPEVELRRSEVPDLVDQPLAHVAPGMEGLGEEGVLAGQRDLSRRS